MTSLAGAQWIWGAGDHSPRNAWRCFRHDLVVPRAAGRLTLQITADTHYVAYVNGEQVGRGPSRADTGSWQVDSWDVTDAIVPGASTAIAVLVHHLGVSTLSYRLARAGLIASLVDEAGTVLAATGPEWLTAAHRGYERRAPRMSLQLGFAEIVDARAWPTEWSTAELTDADWSPAATIGSATTAPWGSLSPRDIPPLREIEVGTSASTALRWVSSFGTGRVVDLRTTMHPGAASHSNRLAYAGLLAFTLRVSAPAEIGIVFSDDLANPASVAISGVWDPPMRSEAWAPRLRLVEAPLPAGDHLVIIDISRRDHGLPFHLNITGPAELVTDAAGDQLHVLGPLPEGPSPHPRFPDRPLFPRVPQVEPGFLAAVGRARSLADLSALSPAPRPVPTALVCPRDVATACSAPASREPAQASAGSTPPPADIVPYRDGFDTEVLLDLGQMTTGYLGFEVEAPEGTVLDICGLEHATESERAYPDQSDGTDNTLSYVCRSGWQRYVSPIRRGMRWIQVTVRGSGAGDVRLHRVFVRNSTYPADTDGAFACSDPLLTHVWSLARDTVALCMLDAYVDSPLYEQVAWVGDLWSTSQSAAYALSGSEPLTRRSLLLAAQSTRHQPLLNSHSASGWDNVIPTWSFLWVLACSDYWRRTTDAEFLREIWPVVQEMLEAFTRHVDERGLLTITAWNFIDWAPLDQPDDGTVTHQNFAMTMALEAAAELADAQQLTSAAAGLRARAGALRAAIEQHLWWPEQDAYRDCLHSDGTPSEVLSVHSQVLAVLAGVQDERQERLVARLADPPEHWVPVGSPWMSNFLYPALSNAGRHDVVIDMIRRDFGAMLTQGATTCWETFPTPDRPHPRSRCHGWSANSAHVLPAAILGVLPTAPGWCSVRIQPQVLDLEWAVGRVPHPQGGTIDVAWSRDGDRVRLRAAAPAGVAVEVVLPEHLVADVAVTGAHAGDRDMGPASDK